LAAKGASSQSKVYSLKASQDYSKLLRNEHAYKPEQIEHIKSEMKETLLYLGYTTDPSGGEENDTGFFKYDSYTEGDKESFMGFRKHNEKVLAQIGTPESMNQKFVYNVDKPVDFMVKEIPALDIARKNSYR
jgi:hypothetical protein